jgi:hypothetical protein
VTLSESGTLAAALERRITIIFLNRNLARRGALCCR